MTSTAPGVHVEGLKRLTRQLKKLDADAPKKVKALNRRGAAVVAATAAVIAPKRTGRLARNVRPGASAKAGVVRAGGAAVPYAGPIHFGWGARNIEPQPFLYDALDARKDEVFYAYDRGIRQLIDETVTGRGAD